MKLTDEMIEKKAGEWNVPSNTLSPYSSYKEGMKAARTYYEGSDIQADGKAAGWIDINETRPEIGKIVLFTLKHAKLDVYTGFRAHGGWYAFRLGEDAKQFIPNDIENVFVTQWMPFPSPDRSPDNNTPQASEDKGLADESCPYCGYFNPCGNCAAKRDELLKKQNHV